MKKLASKCLLLTLALSLTLSIPAAAATATTVDTLFNQILPTNIARAEAATADDEILSLAATDALEPAAVLLGSMTITNDFATSGVCIKDQTFYAYRMIDTPQTDLNYAVEDDFAGFFTGVMRGGDNTNYDFTGLTGDDFNVLAGKYMDSFLSSEDKTKPLLFARAIRQYIDDNKGSFTGTPYTAAVVADNSGDPDPSNHGIEVATFTDLEMGYYFVMSPTVTAQGLGVAADGAFVPIVDTKVVPVDVKGSIPTVAKEIWHEKVNDSLGAWDIVDDSQIGDTVSFRITSTLPSDVEAYQDVTAHYHYYLADTMSAGLTLNPDSIVVYTDSKLSIPLDKKYYELYTDSFPAAADLPDNIDPTTLDFLIDVDVLKMDIDGIDLSTTTLYTGYTAILNENAVIAFDEVDQKYDTNTIELTYSSSPIDDTKFGTSEDTVTHFTFEFGVLKVGENSLPLKDAVFQVQVDGKPLTLINQGEKEVTVDHNNVIVDYYTICPNPATYVLKTGETLTTDIRTTDGASKGHFLVRGIDDKVTYTLVEIDAPDDYTLADPIQFELTVTYRANGTQVGTVTDNTTAVDTGWDYVKITVINELRIVLPSTGGVGTVIFQVVGVGLMLGAGAFLVLGHRSKAKRRV